MISSRVVFQAKFAKADDVVNYERLRDPSHTSSPMLHKLKEWYAKNNLQIIECHTEEGVQAFDGWLALPSLADQVKSRIHKAIEQELDGGPATGLQPFVEADKIKLKVEVARLVGEKR